jgi:hypothetical protein
MLDGFFKGNSGSIECDSLTILLSLCSLLDDVRISPLSQTAAQPASGGKAVSEAMVDMCLLHKRSATKMLF